MKNFLRIMKKVWKVSKSYVFVRCFTTLFAIFGPLLNVLLIKIVLDLIELRELDKLGIILLISISICLVQSVIQSVVNYRFCPIKELDIKQKFKEEFFHKISKLDPIDFEDKEVYDVITKASEVPETRAIGTVNIFIDLLNNIFALGALVTVILIIDWFTIVISLLTLVFAVIISSILGNLEYSEYNEKILDNRKQSYISGLFLNGKIVDELKLFTLHGFLISKFKKGTDNKKKIVSKYSIKRSIFSSLKEMIEVGFSVGMILYLAILVINGKVGIGSFTALLVGSQTFISSLSNLFNIIPNVIKESKYIENYEELLDREEKINFSDNKLCLSDFNQSLTLNSVSFKYPNMENYAVDNVSMKISKGEKIALVGLNGAGKSTFVKLLYRLYEAENGEIKFDNNYINDINYNNYLSMFTIVSQNYQIYQYTIAENIMMRNVTEDDYPIVYDALKKVGLYDEIINLKNGINTRIGKQFDNEAVDFSIGQKQRLAMARAIVANKPIVIMDEPFSALDPKAEYELNNLLLELFKDKTLIIISHRLSTVVHMDNIYVFENGKIIEKGTHKSLMEQNGRYNELFTLQAKLYLESENNGEVK